ncbi:SigB/SigF/SigG family RNA polymerase sigma factor [Nocardioides glacieisoli]|nr:SigB/SigF/SigG family RNA polymerase sigma factor [Nocardioides glacieisoli]
MSQSVPLPPSTAMSDQLVEDNIDVARSVAARYRNRGVDLDDLQQVALLGLVKAARRFDADAGYDFLSYAVPTIRGEVRRYFRDSGWMVRPPRRVQELQGRIAVADNELCQLLGRSPRPSEVAEHLDAPLDDVVEALAADGCYSPTSLDAPVGDGTLRFGDVLDTDDRGIERADAHVLLEPLVSRLSDRDRRVLYLRYYEERTQQEIANALGITQAQVSRILSRLMMSLRNSILDPLSAA